MTPSGKASLFFKYDDELGSLNFDRTKSWEFRNVCFAEIPNLHGKGQLPSMPWLVYRWKGEKGKMWEESASSSISEHTSSLSHAIFIFGDSLVDAGNNDYLVTLSKANAPPYGEALGQRSFPPPYLAPNSSAAMTNSGINYASGSSGIFDLMRPIGRVPLGQQISYFEKTRAQILENMEEEAASDFFKTALFIVAAGSNDILEYLSPSVPFFGREKPDPSYFQDVLLTSIFFPSIKRLNELGARKFVVSDVGPLGCIPYVRALEFMPTGECSASANRVTEGYNKKLKRMVEKMNQEMGPES
ncbi:hypothetical protein PR202_gb00249 [Eleusine coracana subsp. coracana]|uniref:GDSL esterase/lipase n=1 Tax=Eleusine coracana subsp. coracana TaxID=191504 RepID=A0AAV5DSY5_ELECO|nr:hypothetical protein PR202_gb00249 [Eleusine coracana subsp. coracana]